MCLLIVLAQVRDDLPLVVGANRDERLDRPAVPMTVLRASAPRVLGGRDELAGGTWLAVNDRGVVAGLTNRPSSAGPDPARRSRGELPLALASHDSAEAGVEAFMSTCRPSEYNPAWMLVADRRSVFAIDISDDDRPLVEQLPAGIHILENRALHASSPKAAHVRALLGDVERLDDHTLVQRLETILADHEVPEGLSAAAEAGRADVPLEVGAACVHTEEYGTRWSAVVNVPATASHMPTFRYAPGSPCCVPFRDAGDLFR
ncbi:MAG TPA: NRDE family protein [Mycobacteriales bacterium]|nr:NRDE family protein [Mycobacteriales bacterium]